MHAGKLRVFAGWAGVSFRWAEEERESMGWAQKLLGWKLGFLFFWFSFLFSFSFSTHSNLIEFKSNLNSNPRH